MRYIPLLALLAAAPLAAADDADPESAIRYRQSVMGATGKHMAAARLIATGAVPRPQDLVTHATAVHDLSKGFAELFPAGTGPDAFPPSTDPKKTGTTAKPEVWTDAEGFAKKAKEWEEASAKLVEAAKAGDLAAFAEQRNAVGKTCGSCHDAYTIEK